MLLVAVSPSAAEMAKAAGLRFTSEEFTFFLRVAKHALAARRVAQTPRGDFLDLLLEAADHGKQGVFRVCCTVLVWVGLAWVGGLGLVSRFKGR